MLDICRRLERNDDPMDVDSTDILFCLWHTTRRKVFLGAILSRANSNCISICSNVEFYLMVQHRSKIRVFDSFLSIAKAKMVSVVENALLYTIENLLYRLANNQSDPLINLIGRYRESRKSITTNQIRRLILLIDITRVEKV
jgi:hypothetical protein